jgi:CTP:molybdopterin cytidylyltransferase MocA
LRTTLSAMSQDDLKPLLPTRTSSQTGVAAIDLKRLAVLCGCTVDDLHVQTPLQADGILAQPSTEVAFELPSSISAVQTGIDTALISLATRPGVFDTVSSPKALLLLAGEPVLVHVLRQLWLGGIRRVLIVLGAHGAATRSVLSGHPLAFKLELTFLDLGEQYSAGFARSLLPARQELRELGAQRFLVCTSDHIFDPALVVRMRSAPVGMGPEDCHAVALVEREVRQLEGLPPTAVRVELVPRAGTAASPGSTATADDMAVVARVGKAQSWPPGSKVDGIEAGCYAWSLAAFGALEQAPARPSTRPPILHPSTHPPAHRVTHPPTRPLIRPSMHPNVYCAGGGEPQLLHPGALDERNGGAAGCTWRQLHRRARVVRH